MRVGWLERGIARVSSGVRWSAQVSRRRPRLAATLSQGRHVDRSAHEAQWLRDVRNAVLHLHEQLLEWERRGHERLHGRLSANEALQVLLHDPRFAWLRPLSELVVHIDELLAGRPQQPSPDADAILVQARALAAPDAEGTFYARRYLQAIQESPDAVLAHRDLLHLLGRDARRF